MPPGSTMTRPYPSQFSVVQKLQDATPKYRLVDNLTTAYPYTPGAALYTPSLGSKYASSVESDAVRAATHKYSQLYQGAESLDRAAKDSNTIISTRQNGQSDPRAMRDVLEIFVNAQGASDETQAASSMHSVLQNKFNSNQFSRTKQTPQQLLQRFTQAQHDAINTDTYYYKIANLPLHLVDDTRCKNHLDNVVTEYIARDFYSRVLAACSSPGCRGAQTSELTVRVKAAAYIMSHGDEKDQNELAKLDVDLKLSVTGAKKNLNTDDRNHFLNGLSTDRGACDAVSGVFLPRVPANSLQKWTDSLAPHAHYDTMRACFLVAKIKQREGERDSLSDSLKKMSALIGSEAVMQSGVEDLAIVQRNNIMFAAKLAAYDPGRTIRTTNTPVVKFLEQGILSEASTCLDLLTSATESEDETKPPISTGDAERVEKGLHAYILANGGKVPAGGKLYDTISTAVDIARQTVSMYDTGDNGMCLGHQTQIEILAAKPNDTWPYDQSMMQQWKEITSAHIRALLHEGTGGYGKVGDIMSDNPHESPVVVYKQVWQNTIEEILSLPASGAAATETGSSLRGDDLEQTTESVEKIAADFMALDTEVHITSQENGAALLSLIYNVPEDFNKRIDNLCRLIPLSEVLRLVKTDASTISGVYAGFDFDNKLQCMKSLIIQNKGFSNSMMNQIFVFSVQAVADIPLMNSPSDFDKCFLAITAWVGGQCNTGPSWHFTDEVKCATESCSNNLNSIQLHVKDNKNIATAAVMERCLENIKGVQDWLTDFDPHSKTESALTDSANAVQSGSEGGNEQTETKQGAADSANAAQSGSTEQGATDSANAAQSAPEGGKDQTKAGHGATDSAQGAQSGSEGGKEATYVDAPSAAEILRLAIEKASALLSTANTGLQHVADCDVETNRVWDEQRRNLQENGVMLRTIYMVMSLLEKLPKGKHTTDTGTMQKVDEIIKNIGTWPMNEVHTDVRNAFKELKHRWDFSLYPFLVGKSIQKRKAVMSDNLRESAVKLLGAIQTQYGTQQSLLEQIANNKDQVRKAASDHEENHNKSDFNSESVAVQALFLSLLYLIKNGESSGDKEAQVDMHAQLYETLAAITKHPRLLCADNECLSILFEIRRTLNGFRG